MSINQNQDFDSEAEQDLQTILSFDALTLGNLGTHLLFDEINEVSAKTCAEFIIKSNLVFNDRTLTLFINSEGGGVADGFSIIDVMNTSRLPIRTVGIGMIASMGLLILCAGTRGERVITKNTEIMAHQFSAFMGGKHHELMAVQKSYIRLQNQFIKHFKLHSKMTEKQIQSILFAPSDMYLEPHELLKFGLVDHVVDYFDQPSFASQKTKKDKKAKTKKR